YDSKWLTEAIGAPVNTGLDFLLAFEDDDNFEEDDDGKEDENNDENDEDYDDEDFDPAAAYHKFMSEGDEYPTPSPNIITFQLGATKYTLTKNDEEEFPDFSQMNEEQIRAWCFR
ncbi:MAG: hypothetical protein KDD91_09960, partial [Caldilinea sp.]|nr:hypothetical protein [Caldilinea sp.]